MKTLNILEKIALQDQENQDFGFYWNHHDEIFQNINSECAEIKEVIHNPSKNDQLEEELGDLLYVTITLCLFCGKDPEEVLNKTLEKIQNRMNLVRTFVTDDGLVDLHNQPRDVLLNYWKRAKERLSGS